MFPFRSEAAEAERFFELLTNLGERAAHAAPFDIVAQAHQKTLRST
jgi:hypothetical protein